MAIGGGVVSGWDSITERALAEAVVTLADASPDHVYQAAGHLGWCLYVRADDDGNLHGDCIFGQALLGLGAPVEDLVKLDDSVNGASIANIPIGMSAGFQVAAATTQQYQDKRAPWGQAVQPLRDWLKNQEETS